MAAIEGLAIAAGSLMALGLHESWAHRRRLSRIPCRIHISGTRGKSSVTRLIAAALREADITTAAKTTGTLARMILPDAREVPVFRPAGAKITEQIRIVDAAARLNCQVLVIECMALMPELHWVSENKLVRATHGIITNVRADHLDVMGPGEADVARTLAGMIPVRGVLFTAERKHLPILQAAAADRGTRIITVSDEDRATVSPADMQRFRYVEHSENVALSLRVLKELGVDREVALRGMWRAEPDPGALRALELDFFGRRIIFVNAFAANDPQSTETIWYMLRDRYPEIDRVVAVFNLRADRPARTLQLAYEGRFWHSAHRVVLMGSGAYLFARAATRAGANPAKFVYSDSNRVEEVFETIVGLCGKQTLVIGIANIGGQGLGLVRHFRNRARPEDEVA